MQEVDAHDIDFLLDQLAVLSLTIVAQTEAEVRKLNAEMSKLGGTIEQTSGKAGTFGAAMTAGLARVRSGVDGLSNGFTMLSSKAAAVLAIFSTGAGLFSLTKGAMEAVVPYILRNLEWS